MRSGDVEREPDGFRTDSVLAADAWRIVGASVAGTSHRRRGQPCQDAHRWSRLPGGIVIAAVADGAGSAALGEVGAKVAARAAVEAACREADSPLGADDEPGWVARLLTALAEARRAVDAEAAARDVSNRELATTLILVAAMPGLVAAVQVGDGAAVVSEAGGDVIALTVPRSGEYLNETTFLTSPGGIEDAQAMVWRGEVAGVAALTDGLQMLALRMPAGAPHLPFFRPLFSFAAAATNQAEAERQLALFLTSPRVAERTDDDLTLLLLARAAE